MPNSWVFQAMYLPLHSFTGRWSLGEDKRSHTLIIRLALKKAGCPDA
jgi:hypothetical protein